MKLHIGGKEIKDGWKILNIQKFDGVDYQGDISDLSQFEDNSIDEIYASHVVEHVPKKKIMETLKGVHRVLSTNGKFFISNRNCSSYKTFIAQRTSENVSVVSRSFSGRFQFIKMRKTGHPGADIRNRRSTSQFRFLQ